MLRRVCTGQPLPQETKPMATLHLQFYSCSSPSALQTAPSPLRIVLLAALLDHVKAACEHRHMRTANRRVP